MLCAKKKNNKQKSVKLYEPLERKKNELGINDRKVCGSQPDQMVEEARRERERKREHKKEVKHRQQQKN